MASTHFARFNEMNISVDRDGLTMEQHNPYSDDPHVIFIPAPFVETVLQTIHELTGQAAQEADAE